MCIIISELKIIGIRFFLKILFDCYLPSTVTLCGAPALPANMPTLVVTPASSDVIVPLVRWK